MDLNCDMGESFGPWEMGLDAEVLPWVTSISVACGYHAGDPGVMRRTVQAALQCNVAVGAHPGLPDLQGFGRRRMELSPGEAYDITLYQIGALEGIVRAAKGRMHHVKPHGALYHMAAGDRSIAEAIVRAVADFDDGLCLYAPPSSALEAAGNERGLRVMVEAFADRRYQPDGRLVPRDKDGAVVTDVDEAVSVAVELVTHNRLRTIEGETIDLKADTICIHGETPGAGEFARRIHEALLRAGVTVACA